jgi:hypothetical protein
MKITQLSLFLENKPSHLIVPLKALGDAGINIITLSLADTQQFGILRFIVRDWQKAKTVLEHAGCVVQATDMVALEVPDQPGGLAHLLDSVDQCGLNIEYMYAFTEHRNDKAVMLFRFEDADAAVLNLNQRGINVLGHIELFEPAKP